MIEESLIESLDYDTKSRVKTALVALAESGILPMQVEFSFQSIAHGAATEPPEDVAKKVLQYRAESHALLALHAQGTSYIKELNDD